VACAVPVAQPQNAVPPGGGIRHHLHRQEPNVRLHPKRAAPHLTPPVPQQPAAHIVAPGNFGEAGSRLINFRHNPQLLVQPPAASPLNPSQDFHRRSRSCP
jgi:hypothetical protein